MNESVKKEPPRARKSALSNKDTATVSQNVSFVKESTVKMEYMDKITVKEYAELVGCTERYVRKAIAEGKIPAETQNVNSGCIEKSYLISLSSLDSKLRKKYNRMHRKMDSEAIRQTKLEDLSDAERAEAAEWMEILKKWDEFRRSFPPGSKAEADLAFEKNMQNDHPGLNRQQLYRKKRMFGQRGAGGLVDRRGKHDGHLKAIPDEVWNVFEYYYLDQSQKTVAECMRLTDIYFRKHEIDIPPLASSSTFSRAILERIPTPVLKYEREGEKAFRDECGMYIKRCYDDLNSNDIWVCDNHTFDVFINDGEHLKPSRVHLTGFLDVRSRKMVGWYVTMNPSSQATLYALRRGIERYGIPKRILADNGREFLTHDIGGRGHRKSMDWGHEAPTILENLQIEFRTAQVRNARAKIIERAFRDVKECFSRLFEGYTGGTIAERPERLKETGKYAMNFTQIREFAEYVDKYIEGIFNFSGSKGSGMNGRTRNEVYEACLVEKRVASQAELNLMMLRNSKPVKVQREGVKLQVYDTYLYFNSQELLFNHIGQRVYFRYNPDDLHEVRVYDEEDRFLCTAVQQGKLSYYATKEEIKAEMSKLREFERMVKNYKKQKEVEAEDALSLTMWQAEQNIGSYQLPQPKVLTPVRFAEQVPELQEAVGSGETIDYSQFIEKMKG